MSEESIKTQEVSGSNNEQKDVSSDWDILIKINQALQRSDYFADWDWVWVEAINNQQILIGGIIDNSLVYVTLLWDTDALGNIVFSDLEKVTTEEVMDSNVNTEVVKVFNEAMLASIELDKGECKKRRGRVKKAQVAEQINRNKRLYPRGVLEKAVKDMQEYISRNGFIHMDTQHRVKDGVNFRDIRETVALIDNVDFDGEVVSIEFVLVDTQAGKDFMALVDGGAKFQVSQRGHGKSHFQKIGDELIEVVDELHIEGFDFMPSGSASVEGSDAEFLEGDRKMEKELDVISEKINEIENKVLTKLAEVKRKELLSEAEQNKEKILGEALSNEKYNFLTTSQKKTLIDKIKVDDIADMEQKGFTEELLKRLDEEVTLVMKILAESELVQMGYKKENVVKGKTVTSIVDAKPWMETVNRLYEDVEKIIRRRRPSNTFYITDSHPAMNVINAMCERFEENNYQALMNENGQVTQSDIGVKVATISRTIIPAAFRFITAFDVCDVGIMANRIENVVYSVWDGNYTSGAPHTSVGAIEIPEGGTIPVAGIQYASVPILAIRKTMRIKVSSEAIATAKNTVMNPVADSLAYLATDVAQRIDELLWYLMIAQAQRQDFASVTSWETLTRVGSTATYKSTNVGWIQYEYAKAYDANGNPVSSRLIPLFGTTSGNTLQAIVVHHTGGGGTELTYGTHYTINYPDGSITLTPEGVSEVGTNNVQAKYSFTRNLSTWSIIPPEGISGYENLVNLRQAVGKARVKVGNRHYSPNVLGLSLTSEDMISSSPMFTQAGSTPSDVLDRLNKVVSYAGLEPVRTSAMPDAWLLVFERGSCIYRNHTPWNVLSPVRDAATGDEVWIGEEYSGQDVPVKDKLSLVGILDLNTLV